MTLLRLTICVVLYESVEVTKRFHRALLDSLETCDDYEILYFDNSASDTLEEWFAERKSESIHYEHDSRNLGFSFANNNLILRARHERILLLNPDVFGFTAGFWSRLASLASAGEARFARLLNEDGSFQDCVGEPSSLRRILQRGSNYAAISTPTDVGMGIMAFMLTDKSVFARVGLLDCSYPLYGEDMDWCFRARRSGIRIIYDPSLVLTHIGGASARDRWNKLRSLRKKYLAERVFIDKHFRGFAWFAMRLLNALKIILKTN